MTRSPAVPGSVPRWVPVPVVASLAGLACAAWLRLTGATDGGLADFLPGGAVMTVGFLALSLLVLRQQPGNRAAWLFLAVGSGIGTSLGLIDLAVVLHASGREWAAWLAVVGTPVSDVAWLLLFVMPHLLPDGRLQRSFAWRAVAWVTIAYCAWSTLVTATGPQLGDDHSLPFADNPLVGGLGLADWLDPLGIAHHGAWQVLVIGSGPASLVWRWWRGDPPLRRQITAFAVGLPAFCVLALLSAAVGGPAEQVALTGALVLLPTLLGVAILRHQLYGIDRLLSRTLTYSVLTGVLAAVYWAAVSVTTALLPVSSSTSVAVSTLACAAVFQPVRRRLQGAVDERLDPVRARGRRELEAFTGRVAHEVTAQQVADDLVGVLHRTVAPARTGLWLAAPAPQQRPERASSGPCSA